MNTIEGNSKVPAKRWWVIAAIFIAFIIAYFDRVNINLLIADPGFCADLGITGDKVAQGALVSAFLFTYGCFNFLIGPVIDRFGQRRTWMIAVLLWALITFFAGFVNSLVVMLMFRAFLGIGESVNTPATNKTIKKWFPLNERGRASSIWNAATAGAPVVAFPIIAWLIAEFGWRGSFYILGVVGLIPLIFLGKYLYDSPKESPNIGPEELAFIEANTEDSNVETKIDWSFLKSSTFWLAAFGYSMVMAMLYGLLSWMPVYLSETLGFSWAAMGALSSLPYAFAIVGSLVSGWLVDRVKMKANVSNVAIILAGICIYMGINFQSSIAVAITLSVATGLAMVSIPVWFVMILNDVKGSAMATGAGFFNGCGYIASSVTPLLVGVLAAKLGLAGGFVALIGALALCLFAGILMNMKQKSQMAA